MRVGAAALLWIMGALGAQACESLEHRDQRFIVCEVTHDQRVSLHHSDEEGRLLGGFSRLKAALGGRSVVMAMNAGMYHADRRPVGLYIEAGEQIAPLVLRAGPGNFGMLPNGVFCLAKGRARVIESRAFAASDMVCDAASQSGPMLVIDGVLHPRFLPDSPYRNIRNGVGTQGGRTVFAISQTLVTFHEFATLFRDRLGMSNALYFDGKISRIYAPALGRRDIGLPLGPMVAVTSAR